ncbi:hypothetical protein LCGC14_0164840 [marine sediment metagenome]|uniref:Uncharacterized protein n=1 Tax=marine sediment metagenome TaxID=412755 RepID=A0A0F9UUY0_9ZZZZ
MAIADDVTIDYVDRKITYTGGFTDGIADSIYTVNALYSFLQDTFDEPGQMDDPVPMSAQTPTQYTIINKWFMDDETMKALYGGSLQTSAWAFAASEGITQLWWTSGSADPPVAGDIGKDLIVGATTKKGTILAVDTVRRVVWVRNTDATQFVAGDNVVEDGGATVDFVIEADSGAQQGVRSGDSVWPNLFSVGTIQDDTEIYVGQENEWQGGGTTPILTKLASWWDSDSDFTASPNGVSAGHFDILVKTRDAGVWIDDLNLTSQGRLAIFARQGRTIYTHFETNGAVGNFVVPFASTGFDLNQNGFGQVLIPGSFSGAFTIGEVLTAPSGAKAILTAFVTDTSLNYILVGKNLTEFASSAELITGESSGQTATKDGNPPTAINGAVAGGITVTVGDDNTFDIDEDGNPENYAVVVDCNSLALSVVYEHLMFLARRGSATSILPEPGAGFEDGEFYRGVGDAYIPLDAEGTALTEGETVTGSISGATGELVAYFFSGTGYVIVTNVKGSFVNNDVITDEGAGSVTASAAQESLVDVNAASFGTFAGGRFFVARGVVLDNVPAADNNNWQTIDVTGTAKQPPTTITVTFDGLVVNDRATIFEVATAGDTDVVKGVVGLASGAVGSSLIVLDAAAAQDVPATGWIRAVDTGTPGKEERYEYSSISGAGVNVNLRVVSPGDDVCDAGGSATILSDINVGLNFGQDGQAKVGHTVRNVTDSSEAIILRRIDDDNIETTPLTGGTSNDWATSDAYEINTVQFLIDAADTAYFPFIDDTVETGTSLTKSIKFDTTTEIVARARFSDPDVGGQRIQPFELLGRQLTNSDLTITAIRVDDNIAS